jgi:hypothetical protein
MAAPLAGVLLSIGGVTYELVDNEELAHYSHQGYASIFILCAVCFGLGAFLLKNVRSVR